MAFIGEVGARTTTVGNTTTTADYLTFCQATPDVICDISREGLPAAGLQVTGMPLLIPMAVAALKASAQSVTCLLYTSDAADE